MAQEEHHRSEGEPAKFSQSFFSESDCNDRRSDLDETSISVLKSDEQVPYSAQEMKRSRKRTAPKNEGFIAAVCQWTVEHQVGMRSALS